jgi:hypothetical protein
MVMVESGWYGERSELMPIRAVDDVLPSTTESRLL